MPRVRLMRGSARRRLTLLPERYGSDAPPLSLVELGPAGAPQRGGAGRGRFRLLLWA